jgi:hypothetical protein
MVMQVRESKVAKEFKVVNFEQSFNKTKLEDLSLDELANRYADIDNQSQMLKGLILLEARSRFTSNNEFGAWVKSVFTLCEDAAPVRNRLMRYAKFFKDRDQTGISLTACYEISSIDDELAEIIYQEVHGKNLPVSEVKRIIGKSSSKSKTISKEQIMQKVINLVHQLDDADAIEILEKCLKSLNPSILIMKNNLD